jgi:aspartyl-tRNA(Asn)/glutamyl-tRNA(Gln) amidotransferase subunit A
MDIPVPNYINVLAEKQEKEDKRSDSFKVGIPVQFFFDIIDSKVMNVFDKFLDKLHACGISTEPVDVQKTDRIIDTWRAIRLGESAAVHKEWIESRREDYGENVIVMLERGMEITAVEYINAHKIRREIRTAFLEAMKDYDALLVPTTIISAPKLDQTMVNINEKNAMEVYEALSRLTTVFDITGLPAMNVPAGFIEEEKKKLPIGVQLVGKPFNEEMLLRISHNYDEYYRISEEMVPSLYA